MKTVYKANSQKGQYIHYEVVEHAGRRFLIHIELKATGHNPKCCLSVMKPDGTWGFVTNEELIGINYDYELYYRGNDQHLDKINEIKRAADSFKEYIEKVYS